MNSEGIELREGSTIVYNESRYIIILFQADKAEIVNEKGEVLTVAIDKLLGQAVTGISSISSFSSERIREAIRRLNLIKPLIHSKGSRAEVELLSKTTNTSPATIYRWLKKYKETGLMTSLVPEERPGGKGKSRLDNTVDQIIDDVIQEHYKKTQRNSVQNVYIKIQIECRERKLTAPHYNTVRRRIAAISEYELTKHRFGRSAAKKKFAPKIHDYPDALFPLSSVQIDHTPLDIIVVDEKHRKPMGRPWLTLAIDTFSRMVLGYYIGFERPNSMSVGLCLAHAILPKEEFLARLNIFSSWPCHGAIRCIHMDNAMEFRSKMLEEACLEYQMEINWRPVKVPEFGGMIERYLGTFSKEIHQLKGTTFNRLHNRGEYDSEKESVFTYKELETWVAVYIVEVYHAKLHTGINTSPISKWKEGIFGNDEVAGVGYRPVNVDKRKVFLDFMPFEMRTIQDYGVLVDGIHYYSDILRRWINTVDIKTGKLRAKRKFKFKRDPRDISIIYFQDPELGEYFPVPYRDTSHPVMTKWELKMIRSELVKRGVKNIDEGAIFDAYKKLQEIEAQATTATKKVRRLEAIRSKQKEHQEIINPTPKSQSQPTNIDEDIFTDIEAFEDIEDGSSNQ